ncbi:MAG: Protease Do [Patescibacteria group bacterium]|jgi:serine protease Do|nr:Protease Do [Patescibacteria group bacterium]
MDNNELQRAFGAGVLGALLVNVVLGAAAWSYVATPQGRDQVADWLDVKSTALVPIVDSAGEHSDIVNVVEAASPAVVSIVITKDVPIIEKYYDQQTDPFGGIFGGLYQIPQYRQNGTEEKEVGGGSGFLVTEDGYVVTNAHVVSDPEAKYTAFLNDGSEFAAEVVATDTLLDIAVLKIEGNDFSYLEFGDSAAIKSGQSVIAIGNALGEFRNTVSVGVVSGLSRSITASNGSGESEQLTNIIQTDAAINPGNSGGPLLDLSGRVVGVNVAASAGGAENIGFALPANAVKNTVDSIRENGRVIRAYLGVRFLTINEAIQKQNGLSVDHGALVVRGSQGELAIIPGSPADKAGLEENDIILKIENEEVNEEHPLNVVLQQYKVGDKVKLHILHDGDEKDVYATLAEAPQNGTKNE